jgi:(2Fe-2S) ferredoxin
MSRTIRNTGDLDLAAAAGLATLFPKRLKIIIGSASCGVAMGARAVETAAIRAVDELGLDAAVCRTGCIGFCAKEPLLDLVLPNRLRLSYGNMTPEKTRRLLEDYAAQGDLKPEWILGRFEGEEYVSTGEVHKYAACPAELSKIPLWPSLDFYSRQKKVIMRNCGLINPMDLERSPGARIAGHFMHWRKCRPMTL